MRSRLFLYVALAADIGIVIIKFIAAGVTGSSAMISVLGRAFIYGNTAIMAAKGISLLLPGENKYDHFFNNVSFAEDVPGRI